MVSEKGVYMILVIHHEKNDAKSLIHILRLGGLIVESAKPMEAFRYIDASLSAILCLSPEAFPCAEKYIEELRSNPMKKSQGINISAFLNNLSQSLQRIQSFGISAISERRETESQIVLTITIPK
jgi:hypothetical protein